MMHSDTLVSVQSAAKIQCKGELHLFSKACEKLNAIFKWDSAFLSVVFVFSINSDLIYRNACCSVH